MQNIIDFLTFKLLISPYMLIIAYYFGAIAIPIVSWFLVLWFNQWFKNKYSDLSKTSRQFRKNITNIILGTENKFLWYLFFFVLFLSMEIMWRMMLEFLIAYFQIRDALIT